MTDRQAIGKFSGKMISCPFPPGPAAGVVAQAAFEDMATGFGVLCRTMRATPAASAYGTFEGCCR